MADTYRTIQGDAWDSISLKVYGDEKYMDLLITANWREQQRVIFPAGIELQVPPLPADVQQNRNLPPWRQGQ